MTDWPTVPPNGCVDFRILPDGRLATVRPMLFGQADLCVVKNREDYMNFVDEVYSYSSVQSAVDAMWEWSAEPEPVGWHRHRPSNRRRPNADPALEYVAP
jgi:hypothetical protein